MGAKTKISTEQQCVLRGELHAALSIVRKVEQEAREMRGLGLDAPELGPDALQASTHLLRMIQDLTPGAVRKVAA